MPSYSKYPPAIEFTKDDFLTGKQPNGEVRHFTSDAVLEFMKTWLPDLEVSFNNVESITFDTTNEATPAIGEIAWDASDGTIVIGVVGGSIKIQTIDKEIHAATTKTTPIDTDEWGVWDSVNSALRKVTWANIKSTLKTYFDTIYQAVLVSGTNIKTINSENLLGSGNIEIDSGLWEFEAESDKYIKPKADELTGEQRYVKQEYVELKSIEKNPFTETIEIANLSQHSPTYAQTSILNIVKGTVSFIGGTYQVLINTNGSSINFSSDFVIFNNDYSGLTSGQYLFIFAYLPNGKIGVTVSSTSLDIFAPEIESATVEFSDPDALIVTFSEIVTITDTTGLSLNFTTGTAKTLTGTVTGSGTNTLTFALSAAIENGDVFSFEVASNNNIVDDNNNSLESISVNVVNNVADFVTWTSLDGATSDLSGNIFIDPTLHKGGVSTNSVKSDGRLFTINVTDVNESDRVRVGIDISTVLNSSGINIDYQFYIFTDGALYVRDGGVDIDTGTIIENGDILSMRVDSSLNELYIEYYRNGIWTIAKTYAYTANTRYIHAQSAVASARVIRNAKIYL